MAPKPSLQHVLRHPIKPAVALAITDEENPPDQLPAQTQASAAIMGRRQTGAAELEGFQNQSL